jgi:hypothetical protein
MADPKLPRDAFRLAEKAIIAAPEGADPDNLARRALLAAFPVTERAVLRDAAKRMLLLPGLASGRLCPQCHGRYVTFPDAPNHRYRSERWQCAKGHEWDKPDGPDYTWESLLRILARGDQLPDLPAMEMPDGKP